MKASVRQIVNLVAVIAAFATNIWANIAPINGLTIGEIANTRFADVLIIPANYAFIIWGLIYLGLISFAIYQVRPTQAQNPHVQRLGYAIALASIFQIIWVLVFLGRSFVLSWVAMLGILGSLIVGYGRLARSPRLHFKDRWFIDTPLSIYLAWICMATILNGAIALQALNWQGWGISPALWTAVMLVLGGVLAGIIFWTQADVPFLLVVVWAAVAIAIRQMGETPLVTMSGAIVAIALLSVFLVARLLYFK